MAGSAESSPPSSSSTLPLTISYWPFSLCRWYGRGTYLLPTPAPLARRVGWVYGGGGGGAMGRSFLLPTEKCVGAGSRFCCCCCARRSCCCRVSCCCCSVSCFCCSCLPSCWRYLPSWLSCFTFCVASKVASTCGFGNIGVFTPALPEILLVFPFVGVGVLRYVPPFSRFLGTPLRGVMPGVFSAFSPCAGV